MDTMQMLPQEFIHAEENDPYVDFSASLEQACRRLDLDDWVLLRLKHPEREITLNLSLLRDNGGAVNVTAYRAQHSRFRGPSLGPVLMSPDVHLIQLRALAAEMTLQCALLDLLLGGAAGALVIDPDQFSERELHHLVGDYVVALRDVIGPSCDILAPAGNEFTAAWSANGYAFSHQHAEPAAVVGKPAGLGGISDAASVTAAGVVALIEQALSPKLPLNRARIAMQGFGHVGQAIAQRLHRAGARVVAVADRSGGLMRYGGMDVSALCYYAQEQGIIYGFPSADAAENAEVLESDCDVLLLGAAAGQVGAHNAEYLRAHVVIEGVYGAVTAPAERVLDSRGIVAVPALLGTASQTAVWASEWQHGIRYSVPMAAEVEQTVRGRMTQAFDAAQACAEKHEIPLRGAAEMVAVEKLAAGFRLR